MESKEEINRHAYATEEAMEKYSTYQLYPIEKYLFSKFYLPGETVLDLACGGGRTTVRLHELGMKVRGLDLSEQLINMAKSRFPYLSFEVGDYCHLEVEDECTDHVLISHNGLDYAFPEQERVKAIAEAYRVLKKNGTLIISSHNIKSLHFSPYYLLHWKRVLWKLRNSFRAFQEKAYILDLGMYTFFGSPDYVRKQVEKTGLKCVETVGFRLSKHHFFNTYASPYVHYVFKK